MVLPLYRSIFFHGTSTVEVTVLSWYRSSTIADKLPTNILSAKIFVWKPVYWSAKLNVEDFFDGTDGVW